MRSRNEVTDVVLGDIVVCVCPILLFSFSIIRVSYHSSVRVDSCSIDGNDEENDYPRNRESVLLLFYSGCRY
jgi:hypothetical protein